MINSPSPAWPIVSVSLTSAQDRFQRIDALFQAVSALPFAARESLSDRTVCRRDVDPDARPRAAAGRSA